MKPDREEFPLPYGGRGEYEVAIYGEGEIEIGNIAFDGNGTYSYRVYEKTTYSSDYVKDKTVYRVIYKVNMEDDGSLSCDRQIINEENNCEECVFTNIYKSPEVTPRGEIANNSPSSNSDKQRKAPPAGDGGEKDGSPGDGGVRTGDIIPLGVLILLLVGSSTAVLILRHRRRMESSTDGGDR